MKLFGNPFLQLKDRYIGQVGFSATTFGTDWISYYLRQLSPTSFKRDAYGQPTLSGGVRLTPMNGFSTAGYGSPTVTLASREVFPTWFVDTRYGKPMMGYERSIAPTGTDVAKFGDTLVWDNTQRAYPTGLDATLFGLAWADRRVRSLQVKAFEEGDLQNIGFPRLANLKKYITANYIAEQWIEGGIGDYQSMFVKNVNRVVDLVGNGIAPLFRQIPITHEVANGARQLRLTGMDTVLWGQKQATDGIFIAPRIRTLPMQGFEPAELSSRFHVVRNAAYQAKPVGWDSARLGVPPLVVNTRRSFYVGGVGRTDDYGLPFVAPRVRTIGPQNPLDPVRGIIGGATIWFRERPITPLPPDFGWGAFGKTTLDTRRNDVFAKSIPPSWQWGYGALRNTTPEITPYWDTSLFTLFGRTAIFNRWNWYAIEGWHAELWGDNTIITYRTKRPGPYGFDAARYNPKHTIRNVNPDPPGQHYVIDAGLGALGGLGTPNLTNNGLYATSVDDGTFGTPRVLGMSLFPVGITPPIGDNGTQFGTPAIPDRRTPTAAGWLSMAFGKPHLDPYTIWAPQGATQQAIDNHGGVAGEQIDAYLDRDNLIRPLFGRPRVDLKNRIVRQSATGDQDSFGTPRFSRKPQTIVPDGAKFTKYGFPVLFGGDRAIETAGYDLVTFGNASLRIIEPFNRSLKLSGLSTNAYGATWVSNFIRYPGVTGLNATRFGTTWVQRPPPPAYPKGMDCTLWGEKKLTNGMFIAYRIRHLPVDGMDTFVSDYVLGHFRDRMRVRGRNVPRTVSMGDQSIMGRPTLNAKDRPVFPFATLPPASQVPIPAVRKQNRVNLVSLGELIGWGEPWALPVQAGRVQPRGEDFSTVPRPRTSYQLFVDDWIGQLGAARVSQPIGVAGSDTAQFGQIVAMGFGCGKQARVMRGWDGASVGAASVNRGA